MDQLMCAPLFPHPVLVHELGMCDTEILYVWPSHIARVRSILLVVSYIFSLSPFAPGNLVSRDGFGSPVLRQPVHLHTQAEYGAYLQNSSRVPRRRPFIYLNRHTTSRSVPSLSGHANACRWRSLPRVRRLRGSKPQGSSKRVLPWQSP